MRKRPFQIFRLCILSIIWSVAFHSFSQTPPIIQKQALTKEDSLKKQRLPRNLHIPEDVKMDFYFSFLDSIITKYRPLVDYELSEHLLVHANPWIIDSLANTDYYRMIAQDSFVYNQKEMIILRKGQTLKLPRKAKARKLMQKLKGLKLDINLPEYQLRIYEDSLLRYSFSIRIGQNKKRYLAMARRDMDLRTIHRQGKIVAHHKNPDFYNPVDGKQFHLTKRDDGKTTLMPQIPWLETEINGLRNGQMIHPTTNPKTLGKAYSNGCIGTREADAWIIYYYAPIGTPINIRYKLKVLDADGNPQYLEDVYGYQ